MAFIYPCRESGHPAILGRSNILVQIQSGRLRENIRIEDFLFRSVLFTDMIRKYTDEEYENSKQEDKLKLECEYCHQDFWKSSKKIKLYVRGNGNSIKNGNCRFCSLKCVGLAKTAQKTDHYSCKECSKVISKRDSEVVGSGNVFCGSSCAGKFNNKNRTAESRLKQSLSIKETYRKKYNTVDGNCKWCLRAFTRSGDKKDLITCSKKCATMLKTNGTAIFEIQDAEKTLNDFFLKNGRIPGRRESGILLSFARRHFGTWNKMILHFGYTPMTKNLRRKRIKCSDGHIVDSVSEKIIDEFFTTHGITHEVHKQYADSKLISDFFLTDHNVYVEYFGLDGEFVKYDENTQRKLRLFEDNNLSVITLYPKDLFPENKLNELFKEWILS